MTIPHSNTIAIRWRKASATFVIYLAGKVLESGFDSFDHAFGYLQDNCDMSADRLECVRKVGFSLGKYMRQTPYHSLGSEPYCGPYG